MRALVAGPGVVGSEASRVLLGDPAVEELIVGTRRQRANGVMAKLGGRISYRLGGRVDVPAGTDVVVIAQPFGDVALARRALEAGAHVVAAVDHPDHVRALLRLDGVARTAGRTIAVGATMAPGLSCVLARYAGRQLDRVSEIHVASFGTGGPACARRHHAALRSIAHEWRRGDWRWHAGGSGRELVWFPEPVGGADCYRAGLADPLLLVPAFPGVEWVTARLQATRRDRLTSPLPMLRPPHPQGLVGAVRVQVSGWVGGAVSAVIVGSQGRPGRLAGVVAATAARWAAAGRLGRPGAGGLAELVREPGAFLRDVTAAGVPISVFEGLGPGEVGAGV